MNAILGDTVRIAVVFHEWSTVEDEGGAIVDPATATGRIADSNLVTVGTFSPVHDSFGHYHYDWTPSTLGDFYVEFTGTFADSSTDVIRELFHVTATGDSVSTGEGTLEEDIFLTWAADISPMLIDPEEVLAVYPDASPIEAAEFIQIYSSEVLSIFGAQTPSFLALEYVKAATLCSLSKLFSIGGGGPVESVKLGDFEVRNATASGKGTIGNATTWCELAAAIRIEILTGSGRTGLKAADKGGNLTNPIPSRVLKNAELGNLNG